MNLSIKDYPTLNEQEFYEWNYLIRRIQYLLAEYQNDCPVEHIRRNLEDSSSLDLLIRNLQILKKSYVPLSDDIELSDEYDES